MPKKKRLGQHFLTDDAFIYRIIEALAPQNGDRLIEIGPGDGALTRPLLNKATHLTCIEFDRDLIPALKEMAAKTGKLTVINQDILQTNLNTLPAPTNPLRLIGNLPYYISSPILFHCLTAIDRIQDMHFMLQKEVVERMAAVPGSKTYGRLSVMLQLVCHIQPLFEVPARAFSPPPKVDSAIVRLTPKPSEQRPEGITDIETIVKAAFSKRRKTLSNALKGLLDSALIEQANIDPSARAEALSPDQFIALAQKYRQQPS